MKLKVEKLAAGAVKIEYAENGKKVPTSIILNNDQVTILVTLLTTAKEAEDFSFAIDL